MGPVGNETKKERKLSITMSVIQEFPIAELIVAFIRPLDT